MLYMNSVYDWPFDKTHGKGATNIDVLDIHGVPHAEQCDPGIYPSFFLDHGREAGQAAFLDIFRTYIKGGDTADGVVGAPAPAPCRTMLLAQNIHAPLLPCVALDCWVGWRLPQYLDCFDQMALECDYETTPPNCTAIRNRNGNQASIVTQETVTRYVAGKKRGLSCVNADLPSFLVPHRPM